MPQLAELERRSRQESWEVTEPKKVVNFDPWIYAIKGDRLPILREDLEKYLAECLMLTTPRRAIVDKEKGFLHASGATYNELFSRSIEYYQSNQAAVERFQAEWDGFLRAQKLIEGYYSAYGILPPLVLASPPGDVYDVGEKHTKSVTYVGLPVGFDEQQRPNYMLYSIPTAEIDVQVHWNLVESVADVQASLAILSETMNEITPNTVVAMPAILQSVEDSTGAIAKALGLESWEKIEKDAKVSELLDGAYDQTQERRKQMVDWSVDLIKRLVADGRGRAEFEVVQETLRQVFAAERGGKYAEVKYKDVEAVLSEMESLYVGNGGDHKYATRFMENEVKKEVEMYSVTDWYGYSREEIAYLVARRGMEAMLGWIGRNPDAYDSYVGTACGGMDLRSFDPLGRQEILSYEYQAPTFAGINGMQGYSYASTLTSEIGSSSGDKPEGIKETLHCVHCPLCNSDGVDAYITETHIHCSKCKGSVKLGSST